jgi:TPP-dependent 2-oxoacid decarboxylase
MSDIVTIGSYLATRLEQIGLKHHFAVAGDYNLALLNQLLWHSCASPRTIQTRREGD